MSGIDGSGVGGFVVGVGGDVDATTGWGSVCFAGDDCVDGGDEGTVDDEGVVFEEEWGSVVLTVGSKNGSSAPRGAPSKVCGIG